MQRIDGIAVWGDPVEPRALAQMRRCARTAECAAMMADHHPGYAVPIGGVIAFADRVSPSAVGYDIACGNKAVRLDLPAAELRRDIRGILDRIATGLSFGVGGRNPEPADHPLFDDPAWAHPAVARLRALARAQLGTVGGGNHFVDLFVDGQDRVWAGVHCGSRGFGQKTAEWFLHAGGASDGMDVEPLLLDADRGLGAEYLACMALAGRYAYAGRDRICETVARLLGASILEAVHNHHNFAWRERHGGRELWVIRKGATPAFPGQRSFIGGSMGDISVIVEGVAHPEAEAALCSTVHGAGRVMGRREARGKVNRRTGILTRPGRVTPAMMRGWLEREGVELRGGGVDESPHCYKRLPDVLAAHQGSIRILHTLRPVGVVMAPG